MRSTRLIAAFAGAAFAVMGTAAMAQEDPNPAMYSKALNGKRVVLVPMAMGFDLAQGWKHYIEKEVKAFGGTFETRDPNWSVEAGAQAITELISADPKPDVLVVHTPDLQSYSKLFKKAQEAGIYVIQIDNPSNYASDAFVGTNWTELGELEAEAVVKGCGPNSSKKIGLVQGDQVNASSLYQYAGIMNVLKKYPDFEVVAKPDSNWDATTSRNVTTTMLQQHPEVCGIIDFWDGDASGSSAAIRDAGKEGKIFLVTTGGGEKVDCDNLQSGVFGAVVMTELHNQSRDINAVIKFLLQSGVSPGTAKTWIYTLEKATTKADLTPATCWDLKALQASEKQAN